MACHLIYPNRTEPNQNNNNSYGYSRTKWFIRTWCIITDRFSFRLVWITFVLHSHPFFLLLWWYQLHLHYRNQIAFDGRVARLYVICIHVIYMRYQRSANICRPFSFRTWCRSGHFKTLVGKKKRTANDLSQLIIWSCASFVRYEMLPFEWNLFRELIMSLALWNACVTLEIYVNLFNHSIMRM